MDLESLCVVSESAVWSVRVDVHVLNHEGNLAEAASAAVLTALAHFRRPEVTLKGQQVVVHPVSERDPIPLSIHHYPVLTTFAFFKRPPPETSANGTASNDAENGTASLPASRVNDLMVCVDPTHQEESVMAGKLVVGANPYREICTLHLAGDLLIDKVIQRFLLKVSVLLTFIYFSKTVVLRHARSAGDYAKSTVDLIKSRLATDNEARSVTHLNHV